MPITEDRIYDAYQGFITAREDLFTMGEMVIQTKNVLDNMRAAKIASGEITGKNEDERRARTREVLADTYAVLEDYEKAERKARCTFDIAQADVDMVRTLLRLAELTTQPTA